MHIILLKKKFRRVWQCYIVQMLHYWFMLRVLNLKVKNLAFDTIKEYHKIMVFYEELEL